MAGTRQQTGRCWYFGWRKWVPLGAIVVQFIVIFLPTVSSFPHSADPTVALRTQVDKNSGNSWLTEDIPSPDDWNLQCEQESKQSCGLFANLFAVPRLEQRPQLRRVVASSPSPITYFLPRKLAPRSADDDPALS